MLQSHSDDVTIHQLGVINMNIYTIKELREKIASHEYGAEHLLQHAMIRIEELELQVSNLQMLLSKKIPGLPS
jgi:hypothetical protein